LNIASLDLGHTAIDEKLLAGPFETSWRK